MNFVIGIDVMLECDLCPISRNMTGLADVAEVCVVIVILEVAGYATGFQLIRERILAVTIIATQIVVPSVQCKLRITRMIETGVVPTCWSVTVFALLATLAVVRIVFGMAVVTAR